MSKIRKVKGFNCTGCMDGVDGPLDCIEFKGRERLLPRGWESPLRSITLERMFVNWFDVKDPIDLIVDEDYINRVNALYGGQGILIGHPTKNQSVTVDQWREEFGTDGIMLLGIKMHGGRKGVYTKPRV